MIRSNQFTPQNFSMPPREPRRSNGGGSNNWLVIGVIVAAVVGGMFFVICVAGVFMAATMAGGIQLEVLNIEHVPQVVGNNHVRVTIQNESDETGEFELEIRTYISSETEPPVGNWRSRFSIGGNQVQTYIVELPGDSVFDSAELIIAEATPL